MYGTHHRTGRAVLGMVALGILGGCDSRPQGVPPNAYGEGITPNAQEIAGCEPDCATVQLDSLFSVGTLADGVLLRPESLLAAGGTLMSASISASPGDVPLYDHRGKFVKSVGRFGQGPREFMNPRPWPGPNGELWLYDTGTTRITVLSDTGAILRMFPFHGLPFSLTPLDSTTVVMSGVMEQSDGVRFSIHLLDEWGEVIRSFGPAFGSDYHGYPKVAAAPDGTIWLGHANTYRLEQWTRDGDLLRILDRTVPWFEPWHKGEWDRDASMDWIDVDSTGRVWVGLSLPTPDEANEFTSNYLSLDDQISMRDGLIEVIDPVTANVVAHTRFEHPRIKPLFGTSGRVQWAFSLDSGLAGLVIARRDLVFPGEGRQ